MTGLYNDRGGSRTKGLSSFRLTRFAESYFAKPHKNTKQYPNFVPHIIYKNYKRINCLCNLTVKKLVIKCFTCLQNKHALTNKK